MGIHGQRPVAKSLVVEAAKTTSTAVYVAMDANISARLIFVKSPELMKKETVNMAFSNSCVPFRSRMYSSKILAPGKSSLLPL